MFTPNIRSIGALPSSGFIPGRAIGPVPGSYAGILDALGISADFAVSNQFLRSAYTGDCGLVRTNLGSNIIGFEDNKFSGTDWDTATTNGANTAFSTTQFDQSGNGKDRIQGTSSEQPLITRSGVDINDGVNDGMLSDVAFSDGDNFSIFFTFKKSADTGVEIVWSWNDGTNQCIEVLFEGSGKLRINAFMSGSSTTTRTGVLSVFDSVEYACMITYDSAVGMILYIDKVVTSLDTAITGTIDTDPAKLGIGMRPNDTFHLDGSVPTLLSMMGVTLDSTQSDLAYDTWSTNNA